METLKSKAYQIPKDTIKEFHATEEKSSRWEHFDEDKSYTQVLYFKCAYNSYFLHFIV